ncbi:MAG TPA: hypothetical protein VH208_07730, partial [Myxococcaceae bacterium]|nr:hypothetical protein [Myxococcaceae bacterium]
MLAGQSGWPEGAGVSGGLATGGGVGAAALAVFLQLNGPRYRPAVKLPHGVVVTGEAGPSSVEIFHSEDGS